MKTIRFMFDYSCYPLWLYDEPSGNESRGTIIGPEPPPELEEYPELETNLDRIRDIYLSLFINTPIEFDYKGFDSEEEQRSFIELVHGTVAMLRDKLGDKYNIVDDSESSASMRLDDGELEG